MKSSSDINMFRNVVMSNDIRFLDSIVELLEKNYL